MSSAESNAKFTVRSNDPGVRTLGVVVMPRSRRSTTGAVHCGSSAHAISSTESSSAEAVVMPSPSDARRCPLLGKTLDDVAGPQEWNGTCLVVMQDRSTGSHRVEE